METEKPVIVITGATSGLGLAAALDLLKMGAELHVLYRNKEIFESLEKECQNLKTGLLYGYQADLCDLAMVSHAIEQITSKVNRIDILINNAAVWSFKRAVTKNNVETTFQVNVLALLLITEKLLPVLRTTPNSKVINTASALHQGSIQFSNLQFSHNFSSFKAYRQSKLAVIMLTRLLSIQPANKSVKFVSQHPGLVRTGLVRGGGWFAKFFFSIFGISPKKGARNLLYLCKQPAETLENGAYYKRFKPSITTKYSYDMQIAESLYTECNKMINDSLGK